MFAHFHCWFLFTTLLRPMIVRDPRVIIAFIFALLFSFPRLSFADDYYVEPGSLRLSHKLTLEGLSHKLSPGWTVSESPTDKRDKVFQKTNSDKQQPSEQEWGAKLLTEAAVRPWQDIYARILFDLQGQYADRYWRPLNIDHESDIKSDPLIVRQYEIRVDQPAWYAHAFSGVGHGSWVDKGDLFRLYPEAHPESDYLGSSGLFGFYPDDWKQDFFMNISGRRVPTGFTAGANAMGLDAEVAYGKELGWGFNDSFTAECNTRLERRSCPLFSKTRMSPGPLIPTRFNERIKCPGTNPSRRAIASRWL